VSKYLLDTHIIIWWTTSRRRLSAGHRRLLEEAERRGDTLGISAITLWETALLAARGRLEPMVEIRGWVEDIQKDPQVQVFPLTGQIAVESTRSIHNMPFDPADRIIAATALLHGIPLITADGEIRKAGYVPVV
jgi:PIN domain nuclease of toxin-antitoxin system